MKILNEIVNSYLFKDILMWNRIQKPDDVGKLWENYCISERIKHTHYNEIYCSRYFWRTTDRQEIDYIEERDGTLYTYEFKSAEDCSSTLLLLP